MTDVTYGLRDPSTGRFLRMRIESNEGRDFCGSETVTLVKFDDRFDDNDPIYEVADIRDLICTLYRNEPWFNTSRERPGHGGIPVADCDVAVFCREFEHDEIGGDPVFRSERVSIVPIPERYAGIAYSTRSKTPDRIMSGIFGDAWTERRTVSATMAERHYLQEGEPEELTPFVIDRSEGGALEEGMLVLTSFQNTAQIVAIEPLPDSWPLDPGRHHLRTDDLVLVLCRQHDIVLDHDQPSLDEVPSPGM